MTKLYAVVLLVGCSVNASGLQGPGVQAVGGTVGSSSNSDAWVEASQVTVSHPDAGPAVAPDEAPARPDVVYADSAPISAPDARPAADVLPPGPDLAVGGRDVLSPGLDLVAASPDVQAVGSPDVLLAADVLPAPDLKAPAQPDLGALDLLSSGSPDLVVDVLPPPSTVTFSNGVAVGAMTGSAWIALGAQDILESPICTSRSDGRCVFTSWPSSKALCATGYIPMVFGADYTNNWGIEIGVDATQPPDTPIGVSYSTITVNFTGKPTSNVRIELHRSTDPSGANYCLNQVVSGTAYSFVGFNTECQGYTPGTQLTAADIPLIDQVGLQVTASETEAITVTDLCLNSITFGY
jgi:hypothetical protein